MLFSEPQPTQADLHFSLFGIPVRVNPFFWLVSFLLGRGANTLPDVMIWIVAVFVSILVHELGHALVMRRLGLDPWIVLHGMGGLACYHPSQLYGSRASGWQAQVLISVAGPGAGFLLAALTAGLVLVSGHEMGIFFGAPYGLEIFSRGITSAPLAHFVNGLLRISVIWGLVNLLPVYPLDGGHVAREILLRFDAREGIRRSLILSMVTGALLAAWALSRVIQTAQILADSGESSVSVLHDPSLYVALLFGYLAYASYQTLLAYRGGGWRG